QRVDEQAAAHADAAVDAPHGELDPRALERLAPGEHVLVHAVDERAVEIEQEGRAGWHGTTSRDALCVTPLRDAFYSTPLFISVACRAAAPVLSGDARSPRRTSGRTSSPRARRSRGAPGRAPCRPGSRAGSCSRTGACCRA